MQRRGFIRNSTMLLSTLPFINYVLDPLQKILLTEELNVFKFRVGKISCTIFRDFVFKYLAKDFFTNANEAELNQLLLKYNATPDNIPSPFIALLLEYDNKKSIDRYRRRVF